MNTHAVPTRRFVVHDDVGPLRAFYTRSDAMRFIAGRSDLHLVVLPKAKPVKLDLSQFEEALF